MIETFATRLLEWFDKHGRKDLPWQHPRTPYTVWVSEVMLQQTQVRTVIPYFEAFMRRFPNVETLAAAPIDDVLHRWSGLGYYSRGRNLHLAAKHIVERFGGEFPRDVQALESLPGIGRSTAGAIAAMGFGIKAPILDGNVKRVLARHHKVVGYPGDSAVQKILWEHAVDHTPEKRVAEYTQAIMDFGATLCVRRNPHCDECPVSTTCVAYRDDFVHTLPSSKPKKTIPVSDRRFWLIQREDGSCLLERRPTTGLWGGLWSPPERSTAITIETMKSELGFELYLAAKSAPNVFTHVFTHLRMNVLPVCVQAGPAIAVAARDDLLWYHPGDNQSLGLSAVASRLLNELFGAME